MLYFVYPVQWYMYFISFYFTYMFREFGIIYACIRITFEMLFSWVSSPHSHSLYQFEVVYFIKNLSPILHVGTHCYYISYVSFAEHWAILGMLYLYVKWMQWIYQKLWTSKAITYLLSQTII